MKNTDIAMIIFIAAASFGVSYFLGNWLLGDPNDRVENLTYMERVSSDVEEPDIETFNPVALNPTVEVYVGNCGPLEMWDPVGKVCRSSDEEEEKSENDENEKKGKSVSDLDSDEETSDDEE